MDYKETIVLIIAIYGAGLSTYLAWKKRQEYIPKIKISTSENFLLKVHPISSTVPVINVEAKNLGQKRVVFSEGGYLLPNRKKLASFLPTTISFPYELEIEKSVQINMNSKDVAETLLNCDFNGKVKLIPYFKDEIGRTYKGKALLFDIDFWKNWE